MSLDFQWKINGEYFDKISSVNINSDVVNEPSGFPFQYWLLQCNRKM